MLRRSIPRLQAQHRHHPKFSGGTTVAATAAAMAAAGGMYWYVDSCRPYEALPQRIKDLRSTIDSLSPVWVCDTPEDMGEYWCHIQRRVVSAVWPVSSSEPEDLVLYLENQQMDLKEASHKLETVVQSQRQAIHAKSSLRLHLLAKFNTDKTKSSLKEMDRSEDIAQFLLDKHGVDIKNLKDGQQVIKMLFLGNTGSGKSMLGNAAVRQTVFESAPGVCSITRHVSRVVTRLGNTQTFLILYDVPGLIEADAGNIENNKQQLLLAATELKGIPNALFWVMRGSADRILPDDIEGFHTVAHAFGGGVAADGAKLMTPIVNRWRHKSRLQSGWGKTIKDSTESPFTPVFLPEVPSHELAQERYFSADMADVFYSLVDLATNVLENTQHVASLTMLDHVSKDTTIMLEKETLQAALAKRENELKAANDALIAQQEKFEAEEAAAQKRDEELQSENAYLQRRVTTLQQNQGCFCPTDMVLMKGEDGHVQETPIHDLRQGSLVACGQDEASGALLFSPVVLTYQYPSAAVGYKLTLQSPCNPMRTNTVTLTGRHLVRNTTANLTQQTAFSTPTAGHRATTMEILGTDSAVLVAKTPVVIPPPIAVYTQSGTMVVNNVVNTCHSEFDGGALMRNTLSSLYRAGFPVASDGTLVSTYMALRDALQWSPRSQDQRPQSCLVGGF